MSIRVNGKVIASNGDVKTETDNLVTTDTNQTITGIKTFTNSPIVPTPAEDASGQEVVNIEWVNANVATISANVSLSNLDATGQAKFDAKANVDLSNLDATGQAKFDAKADKDIPVIGIPATSGTVTLSDNTVYSGTMTGEMTFTLPAVTNATQYHQIKAMLYLPVVTINWGTTHYIGGEAPDVSGAGQYMIYWDYVPALSAWAVGAMKVG